MFYSVLVRNTVIGLYSLCHCVPDSALCRSIRASEARVVARCWLQYTLLSSVSANYN